VVRKGATPAFPGQRGFVGGSMGDDAVILEGVNTEEAGDALYSTVHGAGRRMSRTQAAGRIRKRKRMSCLNRDCDWVESSEEAALRQPGRAECPRCGSRTRKVWVTEQKSKGLIDWPSVQAELAAKGIELRGGAADEAPGAYKRLPEVLAAHSGSIRILHTLRPIGVAMAGPDVYDEFKD
jgi:tRNA-splicing ligase RtcB (3'-phosphate/5'-hydroxy nucleic acid ligase)